MEAPKLCLQFKKFDHVIIITNIACMDVLNDISNERVTVYASHNFSFGNVHDVILKNYLELTRKMRTLWLLISGISELSEAFVYIECMLESCGIPLIEIRPRYNYLTHDIVEKVLIDAADEEKRVLSLLHKSCAVLFLPFLPVPILQYNGLNHFELHQRYIKGVVVASESAMFILSLYSQLSSRFLGLVGESFRNQNINDECLVHYIKAVDECRMEYFRSIDHFGSYILKLWISFTEHIIIENLSSGSINYYIDLDAPQELPTNMPGPALNYKEKKFDCLMFLGPQYLLQYCRDKFPSYAFFYEVDVSAISLENLATLSQKASIHSKKALYIILVDISLISEAKGSRSSKSKYFILKDTFGKNYDILISRVLQDLQTKIDVLRKNIHPLSAVGVSPIYSSIGVLAQNVKNWQEKMFIVRKRNKIIVIDGKYEDWVIALKTLKKTWMKFMIKVLQQDHVPFDAFAEFATRQSHIVVLFKDLNKLLTYKGNESDCWGRFLSSLKTFLYEDGDLRKTIEQRKKRHTLISTQNTLLEDLSITINKVSTSGNEYMRISKLPYKDGICSTTDSLGCFTLQADNKIKAINREKSSPVRALSAECKGKNDPRLDISSTCLLSQKKVSKQLESQSLCLKKNSSTQGLKVRQTTHIEGKTKKLQTIHRNQLKGKLFMKFTLCLGMLRPFTVIPRCDYGLPNLFELKVSFRLYMQSIFTMTELTVHLKLMDALHSHEFGYLLRCSRLTILLKGIFVRIPRDNDSKLPNCELKEWVDKEKKVNKNNRDADVIQTCEKLPDYPLQRKAHVSNEDMVITKIIKDHISNEDEVPLEFSAGQEKNRMVLSRTLKSYLHRNVASTADVGLKPMGSNNPQFGPNLPGNVKFNRNFSKVAQQHSVRGSYLVRSSRKPSSVHLNEHFKKPKCLRRKFYSATSNFSEEEEASGTNSFASKKLKTEEKEFAVRKSLHPEYSCQRSHSDKSPGISKSKASYNQTRSFIDQRLSSMRKENFTIKRLNEFINKKKKLHEKLLKEEQFLIENPKSDPKFLRKYKIFALKYEMLYKGMKGRHNLNKQWERFWKLHVRRIKDLEWMIKLKKIEKEYHLYEENSEVIDLTSDEVDTESVITVPSDSDLDDASSTPSEGKDEKALNSGLVSVVETRATSSSSPNFSYDSGTLVKQQKSNSEPPCSSGADVSDQEHLNSGDSGKNRNNESLIHLSSPEMSHSIDQGYSHTNTIQNICGDSKPSVTDKNSEDGFFNSLSTSLQFKQRSDHSDIEVKLYDGLCLLEKLVLSHPNLKVGFEYIKSSFKSNLTMKDNIKHIMEEKDIQLFFLMMKDLFQSLATQNSNSEYRQSLTYLRLILCFAMKNFDSN